MLCDENRSCESCPLALPRFGLGGAMSTLVGVKEHLRGVAITQSATHERALQTTHVCIDSRSIKTQRRLRLSLTPSRKYYLNITIPIVSSPCLTPSTVTPRTQPYNMTQNTSLQPSSSIRHKHLCKSESARMMAKMSYCSFRMSIFRLNCHKRDMNASNTRIVITERSMERQSGQFI